MVFDEAEIKYTRIYWKYKQERKVEKVYKIYIYKILNHVIKESLYEPVNSIFADRWYRFWKVTNLIHFLTRLFWGNLAGWKM